MLSTEDSKDFVIEDSDITKYMLSTEDSKDFVIEDSDITKLCYLLKIANFTMNSHTIHSK